MNVLWLSHLIPYPPARGSVQRAYYLLREVAKYQKVSLLAFAPKGWLDLTFGGAEDGEAEAMEALSSFCERVRFLPIPSERHPFGRPLVALTSSVARNPYTVRRLRSSRMAAAIFQWHRQFRFDLVRFETISLAPYLRQAPDATLVLDHHNIESHMMLRRSTNEKNPLKKAYYFQEGLKLRSFEKRYCPQFHLNTTCSFLDSDRLRSTVSPLAIEEVPNGVDLDYFQSRSDGDVGSSLVFVGTLSWYPNRDAVLYFADTLWPLLSRRLPNLTMNVVGAHPPQRLLALTAEDERFKVHGFVPDIRPYLDDATIYVCPLTDGGGTKHKILQALAMSKAIVANPIACEGIDVTPGKNVLFAREPEEYVGHIERLIDDKEFRAQLGRNARSLAERRYSYTAIGKRLADLHERAQLARTRSRVSW